MGGLCFSSGRCYFPLFGLVGVSPRVGGFAGAWEILTRMEENECRGDHYLGMHMKALKQVSVMIITHR